MLNRLDTDKNLIDLLSSYFFERELFGLIDTARSWGVAPRLMAQDNDVTKAKKSPSMRCQTFNTDSSHSPIGMYIGLQDDEPEVVRTQSFNDAMQEDQIHAASPHCLSKLRITHSPRKHSIPWSSHGLIIHSTGSPSRPVHQVKEEQN